MPMDINERTKYKSIIKADVNSIVHFKNHIYPQFVRYTFIVHFYEFSLVTCVNGWIVVEMFLFLIGLFFIMWPHETTLSNQLHCSHGQNVKSESMGVPPNLVSVVTSGGHMQRQQLGGRSLWMHYNNRGNLKVNKKGMYHFNTPWKWLHICFKHDVALTSCMPVLHNN